MGVTIHYAGRLCDPTKLQRLLEIARQHSESNGWDFEVSPKDNQLSQSFVIHPHPDCEPIEFEFERGNRFSSWVKTQFAGPEIHIQIIRFLREIKPVLGRLGVRDEGEFWQTESEETLRSHINKVNEVIASYVAENPAIRVKVKEPGGRIVDLIS